MLSRANTCAWFCSRCFYFRFSTLLPSSKPFCPRIRTQTLHNSSSKLTPQKQAKLHSSNCQRLNPQYTHHAPNHAPPRDIKDHLQKMTEYVPSSATRPFSWQPSKRTYASLLLSRQHLPSPNKIPSPSWTRCQMLPQKL